MALEDDIAALAGAPLLGHFSRDALRLLAFAAESRALKGGDVLFRRGDPSDGGYVVTRGRIAVEAGGEGARAAFLAETGALIGRTALFVRAARPADAVAQEASGVLRISPTLMRRVLEEFPEAASAIQADLAAELGLLSGGLEQVRQRLLAIDEA